MSDLKNKKEQIKKLVLTLVMGVFAFGMSGFSVNEEYTQENCDISRAAVYDYAIYHGHDTQTATNMANNYFWNCFQNGGSSVLTKVLSPYFN